MINLQYGSRYNAAFSTCKTCLFILPKFIKDKDTGITYCYLKGIVITKARVSYDMMINQTLVTVEIPRRYYLDNYIITPDKDTEEIKLKVTWVEDMPLWIKPIFSNTNFSLQAKDEFRDLNNPDDY